MAFDEPGHDGLVSISLKGSADAEQFAGARQVQGSQTPKIAAWRWISRRISRSPRSCLRQAISPSRESGSLDFSPDYPAPRKASFQLAKMGVKVIAHDRLIKSAHRTYDGRELKLGASSIREAIEEGIAIVYQELTLIPIMTVGENNVLGKEPCNGVAIDWNRPNSETAALLKRFQLDISLCTR